MTDSPYAAPHAPTEPKLIDCKACSKPISLNAESCPHCGEPLESGGKNKGIAALLAFFLGFLGIHRFYLGQWWGVFYLLLFWTGLPGLVAFVESIVFLMTSPETWRGKYGGSGRVNGAIVAIVLVVGVFWFIAIIGILAAVSIPAYQDYTIRAKVTESILQAGSAKQAVDSYYSQYNEFPESNEAANFYFDSSPTTKTIEISYDGHVVLTLSDGMPQNVAGSTIVFAPDVQGNALVWECTQGTLEARYRPSSCRP